MLIACPSCATSYDVEMASLCPDGRQVRCLCCGLVWHAELTHAQKLLAAAVALAPDPKPVVDAADTVSSPAAAIPAAEPAGEAAPSDPSVDPPSGDIDPAATTDPPDPAIDAAAAAPVTDAGTAADIDASPIAPADDADDGAPPIDVATAEDEAEPEPEPDPEPARDREIVAAYRLRRRAAPPSIRWPLSQLQSAILVLALLSIAVVGWRRDVVRVLPHTASFYALLGLPVNLRGLTFDDVVTATEQHDGVPVLVVEGNIFNDARKTEDVPRLKFIVRNAARQEIYSWTTTPSRTVLPPGEMVSFRTRLASPPPDAHDLVLRFVSRREFITGAR
ncbi:MAG: zinc-ribbon domain-containing protein [Xanthobacteraceae bacterium]|nr:zinc-ribbon domain-containing protein [Xanthobacteraceae bacterium]